MSVPRCQGDDHQQGELPRTASDRRYEKASDVASVFGHSIWVEGSNASQKKSLEGRGTHQKETQLRVPTPLRAGTPAVLQEEGDMPPSPFFPFTMEEEEKQAPAEHDTMSATAEPFIPPPFHLAPYYTGYGWEYYLPEFPPR